MKHHVLAVCAIAATAACVPPDRALPLGSVSFSLRATVRTREGFGEGTFVDGWTLRVDRALLSFKSMTIGKSDDPDRCSYRGRGAQSNVVFDVREGNVQTFNGILPSDCPDVGLVLGPPDDATVPGAGASVDDLVALAGSPPAHAFIDLAATRNDERYRVVLRFDTATTSSRFGGCRAATRGVVVKPNARLEVPVAFAADTFFRRGFGQGAALFFKPFEDADDLGDGDHVVTMQELDQLPLASLRTYPAGDLYKIDGTAAGRTFGDYVREQFKSVFVFGQEGFCNGNEPGTL